MGTAAASTLYHRGMPSSVRHDKRRNTRPREDRPRDPLLLEADEAGPAAVVSRRASDRLRAGHLWVYRSDVEALIPALGATEPTPGGLLTLLDSRRIPMGTALYSAASQLALRKVSGQPRVRRGEYLEDVAVRVRAALAMRTPMLLEGNTNAARLIFSEADDLPGIVVDRYRNVVVAAVADAGHGAGRPARGAGARACSGWRRRNRRAARPAHSRAGGVCPAAFAGAPAAAGRREGAKHDLYPERPAPALYDADAGQKTGAFLDQRLNYAAAAASYAHGEALDICTYQGGFASASCADLHASVTGVDASRSALETAERNLDLNRDLP